VQEEVRQRTVKIFQRKNIFTEDEASDMLKQEHSGFSLNANVRIESQDRNGLERLIRYCARPIFSGERLNRVGDKVQYTLPKPAANGQTILLMKPSELLDKLAQLIPPPRRHRHHYHGVLAPNSPFRPKIMALATAETAKETPPANMTQEIEKNSPLAPAIPNVMQTSNPHPSSLVQTPQALSSVKTSHIAIQSQAKEKKLPSTASLFRWAMLLARIFEVLPLVCPKCTHPMRIIAFIEDPHTIKRILTHINEPHQPPPITPARGPPTPEFNFDPPHECA